MRNIMLFAAIVIFAGGYWLYSTSGKSSPREWLSSLNVQNVTDTVKNASVTNITSKLKEEIDHPMDGAHDSKVRISKWVDAKGVVHYENRPVEHAQQIEIDPNKNILPPAPVTTVEEKEKPKTMEEETSDIMKKKKEYMDALAQ